MTHQLMEMPSTAMRVGRGVYVHIPFCVVRCAYCDFNAYSGMQDLAEPYVDALIRQVRASADGGPVETIFFGGGTPTQVAPRRLGDVLAAIRDSFDVAPGAEVTVEANPESSGPRVFEDLLAAGFTRVSIGVQSLSDTVLGTLGRVHSAGSAVAALKGASEAGFAHINADLIYGSHGETDEDFTSSLEGVLATGADHISAYALTIEQGTPLAAWVERGEVPAPDDDLQAERYEIARAVLQEAGFGRYEVSNWSKPGAWCRHNLGYWTGSDYLAFGAGAHGHREGRRWWNVRSPQAFISRSPDVEDGSEVLSRDQRMEEAAVLGLRLAGGIDRPSFAEKWGVDPAVHWSSELGRLGAEGLVVVDDRTIRVAEDRVFVSGAVARALMS